MKVPRAALFSFPWTCFTVMSTASVSHGPASELRSVDRELLLALRRGDAMTVGELTGSLGVTATAVRQRVERLLEKGLIDREKVVAGRGRPTYRYCLTVAGYRRVGANPSELADAMWHEILAIPDGELRERLVSAVAGRLGRQFAAGVDAETRPVSFEARMRRLADLLAAREIDSEVSRRGGLPVLDIGCCPFPSLTDESDERVMCRLEEQMLSEALGQPVHLSSCRLDGDQCCQFTPTAASGGSSSPADSAGL